MQPVDVELSKGVEYQYFDRLIPKATGKNSKAFKAWYYPLFFHTFNL